MRFGSITVFIVASLALPSAVVANPRFLVLSGGGSPRHNHHSQYLQTLTLVDGLRSRFGDSAVDVYFGAGNSPQQPRILPDVHAKVTEGVSRRDSIELTRRDVVSGKRLQGVPPASMQDAHNSASWRDTTIDIPMASSDYYLQSWYDALWAGGFKPRTSAVKPDALREMSARVVSSPRLATDSMGGSALALRRAGMRLEELATLVVVLGRADAAIAELLHTGTETAIMRRFDNVGEAIGKWDKEYGALTARARKIRFRKLVKPWMDAIHASGDLSLDTDERKWEREYFMALEKQVKASADGGAAFTASFLLNLSAATAHDQKRADKLSAYVSGRGYRMATWAKATGDKKKIAAVLELERIARRMAVLGGKLATLERRQIYLRRILEKRQQLSALAILSAMQDAKAIADLESLMECENTRFDGGAK